MRFLSNLHTHTFYSDGIGTPEEYVEKAIEKGFVSLGFSDHAPILFETELLQNERYGMFTKDFSNYRKDVLFCKEKYKDEIQIYLGIEEDYLPALKKDLFDFTIGAIHNFRSVFTGKYISIDHTPEKFEILINSFDGIEKFIEAYYYQMTQRLIFQKPDIIAHFDLITKFNRDNRYFDTSANWYKRIIKLVLNEFAKHNFIIEVNTGAISRGYKDNPYPSEDILYEIKKLEIPVTISSDCHSVENLDFWFDESIELLKHIGISKVKQFYNSKFIDVEI